MPSDWMGNAQRWRTVPDEHPTDAWVDQAFDLELDSTKTFDHSRLRDLALTITLGTAEEERSIGFESPPRMTSRRLAFFLCVFLPAAACSAAPTPGPSEPPRRDAPPARFSVSSYRVDRGPGVAKTREIEVSVSGKNTGGRAGTPVCFLSFGSRGRARVRGSTPSIEPGVHFLVEGTAVFDPPLPAGLESEDAYCRASS